MTAPHTQNLRATPLVNELFLASLAIAQAYNVYKLSGLSAPAAMVACVCKCNYPDAPATVAQPSPAPVKYRRSITAPKAG